jgi:hypothetical protein
VKKRTVRKPRYFGLKLSIGLFFAIVGGVCIGIYAKFESTAVHTTATVVELKSESHATGRKGGRVYIVRPLVEFENPVTKEKVKAVAKVASRSGDFTKGEAIPVEFDPRNPDDTVRVETGLSALEIGVLIAGFVIIGYALSEQLTFRREARLLAATAN